MEGGREGGDGGTTKILSSPQRELVMTPSLTVLSLIILLGTEIRGKTEF